MIDLASIAPPWAHYVASDIYGTSFYEARPTLTSNIWIPLAGTRVTPLLPSTATPWVASINGSDDGESS